MCVCWKAEGDWCSVARLGGQEASRHPGQYEVFQYISVSSYGRSSQTVMELHPCNGNTLLVQSQYRTCPRAIACQSAPSPPSRSSEDRGTEGQSNQDRAVSTMSRAGQETDRAPLPTPGTICLDNLMAPQPAKQYKH